MNGESDPKLLVSVQCADEAAAALVGGADVIDAKDPSSGALGAVSPETFTEIHATVRGRALVTAAVGDASDETQIERLAADYASRGASLVKVGFAGTTAHHRVDAILAAAARACARSETGVVAVAYADAERVCAIDPRALIAIAARNGARGVLVDTADKDGPGLSQLWNPDELATWVAVVRGYGLLAAVAGKLAVRDLALAREAGAEIVGVRGAACVGGRTGCVSADRVRELRVRLSDGRTARRFAAINGSTERV